MSNLKLKLIEHKIITKALEKAKGLFDSITCLRVEGVEFFSSSEILDSITREAVKGHGICKDALEPPE